MNDRVERLLENAKTTFDLTESTDQARLYRLTNALLETPDLSISLLQELARHDSTPLEFKIAVKLVESRQYLLGNTRPLKIGITFSMWGEQHRLRPKSSENPYGEDALRVKLDQLAWVTQGTMIDWTLYPVDGGCPYGSGKIAEEIAAAHPCGRHVKVLYLDQFLPVHEGPLAALQSADDSRKGGEVLYGSLAAIRDGADVAIYTDADNSVHLGQIGLLLKKVFTEERKIVLGNRKDADSVLIKQEDRTGPGITFFRHIQRMILRVIVEQGLLDTQAPFKLYERQVLNRILPHVQDFGFSFDTDWLLAAISIDQAFESVPFAFIDSAADSSFLSGRLENMLAMLQGIVTQVRYHGVEHNEEMARIIDEEIRTPADLKFILNTLPPQLQDAREQDLGDPLIMSPAEIQVWMQQNRP